MNTLNMTVTMGLSLFLVILTGCSKSFLDKELIGVNPQTGSMENPENARAAVNACYAYVNGGDWNQGMFPRLLMESSTDNGWGANDYQDRPAELGVCDFTGVSPNNSYIDYFYKNMHEGIRNCNYVITKLAEVKTLSEQLKNQYIAEARFLRAYFYFELVKDFGGDVMHNSFDPADATLFLAKSPPADIYKQIYKDLEEAIAVLPAKDEYGNADVGRATKGAAMGYLAKAYLFNGDYANAEAAAQAIISSNKYSLETTFSKIFEPENVNGTESLFEVNYKNAVGFGNGPIPAEVTGAATVDGGWGWFGLTSDLENAYIAEGDNVRRKATINKAGEVVDNETPARIFPSHMISGKPAHTSFRYYRKYYIPLNKRVGSPWQSNDIKMRFAEILLIHAEAAAFNNKEAEALTSLNKVRARVGLADKTGLSGDALKLAIWNERRLELAGEGTFRWDGNMGELTATKTDGLIYKSKMLWALGNYSRFIRPGMIRVDATLDGMTSPQTAATKLMISAYKNPATKEVIVVVINMTNKDENIKLTGLSFANAALKTYTTSDNKELQYSESNAGDKLKIGARSITTFVGTYK